MSRMANPLNNRFNKANWSAAANAAIVLINGRLPVEDAMTANEQGLLMIIVTFLVVCFVPRAEAPTKKPTVGV